MNVTEEIVALRALVEQQGDRVGQLENRIEQLEIEARKKETKDTAFLLKSQ